MPVRLHLCSGRRIQMSKTVFVVPPHNCRLKNRCQTRQNEWSWYHCRSGQQTPSSRFLKLLSGLACNGQGLLQGWNSLLVRPEPLLIKDIKVQVNKQKPSNVCPAQMKHNSDKMTIAPMSSQPCSKPNVSCGAFLVFLFFYKNRSCICISGTTCY